MKKLIFSILAITMMAMLNAQESRYGLKAGFNSLSIRASSGGSSASENISGFYIGSFAEFAVSENFDIQPELQYISVSEDGGNSAFLVLPVLAKYNANDKFGILAGPQLDYLLDEDSDGLNKLGLSFAAGLSYEITDAIFIDGRYTLGLSNRLEDADQFGEDLKIKFNMIQIGLGYKF